MRRVETSDHPVLRGQGETRMSDHKQGWFVRGIDVSAVLAWVATFAVAAACSRVHGAGLAAWCAAAAAVAAVLSAVAYCGRRFDRLEREAFDRGLRAGMGVSGVSKIDEHRY